LGWERVGKREFSVEEGNERSECRKTVGFRGAAQRAPQFWQPSRATLEMR
jgi:hypothetical protein